MQYRLIQTTEAGMVRTDFDAKADFLAAMALRGYRFAGENRSPAQRAELQGQPRFRELCGPMWDGDAVRYEDQEANDRLSA